MKLQFLFVGACLLADALAVPLLFYSYYRGTNIPLQRNGSIRDHKAQALVDGMRRWSSHRFEAFRSGGYVVVRSRERASDEEDARRVLNEMVSLVAHYAADD